MIGCRPLNPISNTSSPIKGSYFPSGTRSNHSNELLVENDQEIKTLMGHHHYFF